MFVLQAFLDDIFLIWTHGREEFDKFLEYINKCSENIKFTVEISDKSEAFLDMTVNINPDGSIWTDLYMKPTDSHNYLDYNSAHPAHSKKSLPYSQFLRVRRICSREEDFNRHCCMMKFHLLRRGYPAQLLNESYERAKSISTKDVRSIVDKEGDDDPFFLVTTYNPQGNALRELVEKHWEVLERSSATKQLSSKKPMFGYRWCANLRDLLVSAKIKQNRRFEPRQKPNSQTYNSCKTKNCRYCTCLDTTGTIVSTSTGRKFQSRINLTCKSTNLIYCITCKACKLQYVGQTKGTIMDRFKAHFGVVNRRDMKEDIGLHFNGPNHHGISDMTIHALHFIYAPPRRTSLWTSGKELNSSGFIPYEPCHLMALT